MTQSAGLRGEGLSLDARDYVSGCRRMGQLALVALAERSAQRMRRWVAHSLASRGTARWSYVAYPNSCGAPKLGDVISLLGDSTSTVEATLSPPHPGWRTHPADPVASLLLTNAHRSVVRWVLVPSVRDTHKVCLMEVFVVRAGSHSAGRRGSLIFSFHNRFMRLIER